MDRYEARINLHGTTERERILNRERDILNNKVSSSLSYKNVKLNGTPTQLIINSGTKPYYKEFQSLPGEKILAGDYVEWANNTWLVYEADSDDELYIDGTLRQCQQNIYWQNANGEMVSRYAWIQNASAYNNGEDADKTMTLKSNQFMVYMPYDDETMLLDNGKRVHMSRSNSKCNAYGLTRPDDITYGYGEKGVLNIIFTQDQTNTEKDKLVTLEDGTQVWICNYISITLPPSEPTPDKPDQNPILWGRISYKGDPIIKAGGAAKTFTFVPTDENGEEIECSDYTWKWDISDNFKSCVAETITSSNALRLKIEFDDLIVGEMVLISVLDKNENIITSISIEIGGGL